MEIEAHNEHTAFVLSLRCAECARRWDDPTERWRVSYTDTASAAPVTYCPRCAKLGFEDRATVRS